MTQKRIQQLRSSKPDIQRTLAFKLAEIAGQGDEDAYRELLRMAGGDACGICRRYPPEAQLIGIEALAKTGLPQALECLQSWREFREVYTESCTGLACGSDHHPEWSAIKYDFYNAPINLRKNLSYTGPRFSLSESRPQPMSENDHQIIRNNNPFHLTLDRAIEQLEDILKKNNAK